MSEHLLVPAHHVQKNGIESVSFTIDDPPRDLPIDINLKPNFSSPAIVNGECAADISSAIVALPPGTYIATVTAMGTGGSAQSAPSPQFSR